MDCVWDHPPTGWLKFNIARIVVEEVAGCGGVLRDEKGLVLALFYGKCGACGVEQAVVMAGRRITTFGGDKVCGHKYLEEWYG
ncbi:hypothetical protein GOBAR_AA16845 [Gossypium barbadense]|uniref:RNase H type-1 domain-containing protein n=1 Tax=Gossypium barbadense TaxID=3634 RepID=A0A2P5XKE3_GOSBA|nr:hypothetical protein GOBAR_AA16845 [Gossypium barbadense]